MWAEWQTYVPSRPRRERFRRGLTRFGKTAWVALAALSIAALAVLPFSPSVTVICLAAAALGVLSLGASGMPVSDEDLLRLRDIPCPLNTYLVDLIVQRRGATTGKDSGVLTFVDGWLVYSGLRTSFSVSAIRCLVASSPAGESVFDAGRWQGCKVDAIQDDVSVFFKCRDDDEARSLARVMTTFLNGWTPTGIGVLPPLGLANGVMKEAKGALRSSSLRLAFGVILAIGLIAFGRGRGEWMLLSWLALNTLGHLPDVLKHQSKVRKLTRIATDGVGRMVTTSESSDLPSISSSPCRSGAAESERE